MKVKHLDHLNLTVRDFDETAAWYGRVFGFEVVEQGRQRDVRWGILRSGDALLAVYEHPELRFAEHDELGVHGINHFGLRIEDRDAWLATVEREGIEVHYGGVVEWPHSEAWYITDPTGYEIEVAYWREGTPRFG